MTQYIAVYLDVECAICHTDAQNACFVREVGTIAEYRVYNHPLFPEP